MTRTRWKNGEARIEGLHKLTEETQEVNASVCRTDVLASGCFAVSTKRLKLANEQNTTQDTGMSTASTARHGVSVCVSVSVFVCVSVGGRRFTDLRALAGIQQRVVECFSEIHLECCASTNNVHLPACHTHTHTNTHTHQPQPHRTQHTLRSLHILPTTLASSGLLLYVAANRSKISATVGEAGTTTSCWAKTWGTHDGSD